MLIFVLGGVTGAAIMEMVHRSRQDLPLRGTPEQREAFIVKRLTRKLDLDQKQQEQVRVIIHENHQAMQEIRARSHPQIEAVLDEGQKRITAVLNPEQQRKFQQIIAERKERHGFRHGNR